MKVSELGYCQIQGRPSKDSFLGVGAYLVFSV